MKVSIITSIPWLDSSRSHEEVYREAVEQVRLADELGFDCAWFTELHFGTNGINGAVLPFAAYIAGITRRIRVGTAVVVGPLYHPMRLAEEVSEVDLLSGGRLELGIGSGYRFDEFRGYNVEPAESRARFPEIVEILLKAWQGAPFSYEGKYYKIPDGIAVRPVPLQKPHPPLWVPAFSPSTVDWVDVAPRRLPEKARGMVDEAQVYSPDVCFQPRHPAPGSTQKHGTIRKGTDANSPHDRWESIATSRGERHDHNAALPPVR